ncbi:hypothetical protein ACFY2R_28765, partial [Micromonospora olivasterospora]
TLRRPIMTNTHPKHAVALGAAMLSSDTHTAHPIPAPRIPTTRRTKPNTPTTTTARTSAPPTAAEHDSGEHRLVGRHVAPGSVTPAPAAGAPAPKAKRGAKHRARSAANPTQPVTGPTGDTHPADLPSPARRQWSRLANARLVVTLVVVFGLLGVALVSGNDAPSHRPQVSSATSETNVPSERPQAPSATPATIAPSKRPQVPSATPATIAPSKRPQAPSATPATIAPSGRPMLKLEDVQVHKPSKLTSVRPAVVGTKHFVDRSPVFTSVPAPLTGAVLIPGSSNDKRLTAPADYLVFDVTHDATVYVALDRRGAPDVDNWWPAWLNQQGFKRTDMIIPTNDKDQRHFVVFAKKVPAGRVTLGPNAATSVYSTGYITLVTAD